MISVWRAEIRLRDLKRVWKGEQRKARLCFEGQGRRFGFTLKHKGSSSDGFKQVNNKTWSHFKRPFWLLCGKWIGDGRKWKQGAQLLGTNTHPKIWKLTSKDIFLQMISLEPLEIFTSFLVAASCRA